MTKIDPFEEVAFEMLANVYPHEMHGSSPERFWCYFHEREPTVSRENMVKALEETWVPPEQMEFPEITP